LKTNDFKFSKKFIIPESVEIQSGKSGAGKWIEKIQKEASR